MSSRKVVCYLEVFTEDESVPLSEHDAVKIVEELITDKKVRRHSKETGFWENYMVSGVVEAEEEDESLTMKCANGAKL